MMHWQSGMKRLFAFLFRKPRWYRDAEALANQYDSQIEAECLKWDEEAQARAVPNLIADWRARAKMYQERFYQSTQRREYIIAAQQQGLATAFTVCANELEANLTYKLLNELEPRD